jgi:hypothetical protein
MKWRLQFFLLLIIMSALTVGGIHLAEKGTRKIDGHVDGPVQSFSIVRAEQGELEVLVFGRQYSLATTEHRNEIVGTQAETGKGPPVNWVSKIGNEVGERITAFIQEALGWIQNLIVE